VIIITGQTALGCVDLPVGTAGASLRGRNWQNTVLLT
jgi:hypothetical protein